VGLKLLTTRMYAVGSVSRRKGCVSARPAQNHGTIRGRRGLVTRVDLLRSLNRIARVPSSSRMRSLVALDLEVAPVDRNHTPRTEDLKVELCFAAI